MSDGGLDDGRAGADAAGGPDEAATPYARLGPETVLAAVESAGHSCDGHLLALNSYENRVYQVGLEDAPPLVVKFYRPGRWSDEQILEEHRYTLELAEREIPVVAPLADDEGRTLLCHGPFRFALYPRCGGRAPDLEDPGQLEQCGRFLGRIHAYGAVRPFEHRPELSVEHFGVESYRYLLEHGFIPCGLEAAYRTLAEDLIVRVRACYERAGAPARLRLHGDCHPGNILWTDDGPHIVDFDDARTGPAVQDLWMFLSGDRAFMNARLADLLEGYTQFQSFDPRELHLIEALRTLRMLHYAAWIARRWDDPAFP
ncbi:MAG TPA: serine/threonine protein kinase, partial [Chromatiales bacterium]|nr:serine/threonine protein kinase [Chromatiales bacterium]